MFLKAQSWDSRSGQHTRGAFLMLAFPMYQPDYTRPHTQVTEERFYVDGNVASTVYGIEYTDTGERCMNVDWAADLRAFVRYVQLDQLGHFMMGCMHLTDTKGITHYVHLSGGLGGDGLPVTLDRALWERGMRVPAAIGMALAKDRAGSWDALRTWAMTNHRELSAAGRAERPTNTYPYWHPKRGPVPAMPPKSAPVRKRWEAAWRRVRLLDARKHGGTLSTRWVPTLVHEAAALTEKWRAGYVRNGRTKVTERMEGGVTRVWWRQQEVRYSRTVDASAMHLRTYFRDGPDAHPSFRTWVKREIDTCAEWVRTYEERRAALGPRLP